MSDSIKCKVTLKKHWKTIFQESHDHITHKANSFTLLGNQQNGFVYAAQIPYFMFSHEPFNIFT